LVVVPVVASLALAYYSRFQEHLRVARHLLEAAGNGVGRLYRS